AVARLQDKDALVRYAALQVIAKSQTTLDDSTVDGLLDWLGDTEGPFCGQPGSDTRERLQDLIGSMAFRGRDRNRDVAIKVLLHEEGDTRTRALKKLEPILLGELRDSQEHIRLNALYTLGKLGDNGSSMAPGLEALLKDPDSPDKADVYHALKMLGHGQG